MEVCDLQEVCDRFIWKWKARNEHVRQTEICIKYVEGICSDLDGSSCDISKGDTWRKLNMKPCPSCAGRGFDLKITLGNEYFERKDCIECQGMMYVKQEVSDG